MQKLINILVILFIIIGMVFFGAKAISSDHHAPQETESQNDANKEKSDKEKKEKKQTAKKKKAESENEEAPVYDESLSQEATLPTEQTEIIEAEETPVEDVQQPDTTYTPPVQQAPAYTPPQNYVPQQAPSNQQITPAEQANNVSDNQYGQPSNDTSAQSLQNGDQTNNFNQ